MRYNFTPTREERTRGYKKITNHELFEVYAIENPLRAMAFVGKSAKTTWAFRFRSQEELDQKIETLKTNLEAREQHKKERRETRQTERDNIIKDVKVGDIFSYSWGYGQTNVDLFQCVGVSGKTFKIRAIGGRRDDDDVVAVKDSFRDDEIITKRSMSMDHGVLHKTSEIEKHYQTPLGYGH